MRAFEFSDSPLEPERYRAELGDASCGGYASFEGWVRDHNEGRRVHRLEYEAFESLAVREGERIVAEAVERYGVTRAACVHRVGALEIGDLAVWVGVSAPHRGEAFAACRYIIDEVKHRVPIWKKEHYTDGDSGWVNCERCAAHAHDHHEGHGHEQAHPAGLADRPREPPEDHARAHPGGFVHDYSRQTALPEVGHAGQARLAAASVLVVGAGGLGVPVLQYLAAAGVGRLGIVDGNVVEASSLHRQPLYGVADVGRPKAVAAAERLAAINADARIEAFDTSATAENLDALVESFDLVVDCTDDFRSKLMVNDAVVRAGLPAIFATVHEYEGRLQVYRPEPDWPCLRCVWPEMPDDGLDGARGGTGVLGPVPATLGSLEAMQALKRLLDLDRADRPGMLLVDLLSLETRWMDASRRPDCEHGPTVRSEEPDYAPLELEFRTLEDARASGFELIDIREVWDRHSDAPGVQIPAHVPLSDLVNGRTDFPAGGRYLIVCAHGVRSLALTEHLRARGRADVYSMRGGLAALRT